MTGIKVIVEHSKVNPETVALIDKAIEEKRTFSLTYKNTYAVYDPVKYCWYHEGCTRIKFLLNDYDNFIGHVSKMVLVYKDYSDVELKRNSNGYERYILINNNNS